MSKTRAIATACFCTALLALPAAQADDAIPTARLISASRLVVPGAVDSNVPMIWERIEGVETLFGLASWGGIPALMSGPGHDRLRRIVESVEITGHPGHGVWIESVIADESGTWYGYYHHEAPATICAREDRAIPRIGALKSSNQGRTWEDLGIILEAPAGSAACTSANRFVIGGVGDLSAMLDAEHQDLYLFFSQYARERTAQGVAVARMAWADRDAPAGRAAVWHDGAWIPPRDLAEDTEEAEPIWEYAIGTPLDPVSKPWHDGDPAADVFWGPSVHWNTYLERYVMLLNRAKDESFNNDGIYVAYARTLDDPAAWTSPRKLMNGGGWYPQVAGLEHGQGTDKLAGQRARFFLTGRSDQLIEFRR